MDYRSDATCRMQGRYAGWKPARAATASMAVVLAGVGLWAGTALAAIHGYDAPPSAAAGIEPDLAGLVIPFEANHGQFDAAVAYAARTFAGTLFVTRDGRVVHALPGPRAATDATAGGAGRLGESATGPGWAIVETMASPVRLKPEGRHPTAARVSRFTGNDPSRWQESGETYERVRLGEPWPGIAVELAAHGRNVEKLFTVQPGADARRIALNVRGARGLRLAGDGALIVATGNGEVAFTPPVAYQDIGGRRVDVPVRYQLAAGNHYRFVLGDHDRSQSLVIDPLLQSTYLAGSTGDGADAVALDGNGNVYLTGFANSTDFPGVAGGAQTTQTPSPGLLPQDAFVAKLSPDLKTLIQATYLGGSGADWAHALALDSTGNVYITGETTSTDFPGTAGGAQSARGGAVNNSDVFVAKLSGDLKTLIQSTYLGGSQDDHPYALAIGNTGTVYVAGYTSSNAVYVYDFPGTAGGALSTVGPNTSQAGFVAALAGDLKTLSRSTLLAGSFDHATIYGMTLGAGNAVYVVGQTYADNFPGKTGGALDTFGGSPTFGFVTKFSSDLTALTQSTYIGGHQDSALAVALDTSGNVFVAGMTDATVFPGTAGGAQPAIGAPGTSAFVTRFSGDLTTIVQSTYFGGSGNNNKPSALAVDGGGHVFIAGLTNSADLPGSAGGAHAAYSSGTKAGYAARFSGDLKTLVQSTYIETEVFGGPKSLAIDTAGDVYVAGVTDSHSFPGTAGGAQPSVVSGNLAAAWVAKFSADLAAASCVLDVDGNGTIDALTDGLMILRVMFGLTGAPVTNGAIGPGATRTTWAQVQPVIQLSALDIDGNGTTTALTDGLIILRAMFGLTGTSVTTGTIGAGATRTTWAQIQPFLNTSCGANFAP